MAIACCVCAAVYLALSSGLSLISRDWGGIPTSTAALPAAAPWGARAKKRKKKKKSGGVEGGKWRGTQTGSGCNFLRKLSEPFFVRPIRWNEGQRKRKRGREMERKTARVRKGGQKVHQRNLLSQVHMGPRKGSYCTAWTKPQRWTNEEQSVQERGRGWLTLQGLQPRLANISILKGFLRRHRGSTMALRWIHEDIVFIVHSFQAFPRKFANLFVVLDIKDCVAFMHI